MSKGQMLTLVRTLARTEEDRWHDGGGMTRIAKIIPRRQWRYPRKREEIARELRVIAAMTLEIFALANVQTRAL